MESSKVYFTDLHTTPRRNLLDKMELVVRKAGIANINFDHQFAVLPSLFGKSRDRDAASRVRGQSAFFTDFRL